MASVAKIPITNVFMDGDYTGQIFVGPDRKPMNVILDTGSSALALNGESYAGEVAAGDLTTNLAQTDTYGDQSTWTGAVIHSTVAAGDLHDPVVLPGANVAIAYDASENMFRKTDGILGLAYAPLDDAFKMPSNTFDHHYTAAQVRGGQQQLITPYLTQLQNAGIVADKLAFYTRRSFVHAGGGGQADPLNNGWMILGGGEEFTDLYSGTFQSVKVLSDSWYCTNLKAVVVGSYGQVAARVQGPSGMPSNSIIDSGTNSLSFGVQMLQAIAEKLPAALQEPFVAGLQGQVLANDSIKLADWPTLTFVLEGTSGPVRLDVPPANYWQLDAGEVGKAGLAITPNNDGNAILVLPLMNGYFTIFDGEADGGRGVVNFAQRKG